MIKGIRKPSEERALRFDEQLVVPIVENTCFEEDLQESMALVGLMDVIRCHTLYTKKKVN
jgi:hypothetical protein